MTSDPMIVPDFTRLARQESRRWTLIGALAFLLAVSIGLNGYQAIEVRTAVDSLETTTAHTARAVELLEGRTPLFSELQAVEARVECVSVLNADVLDALAAGLVAVAVGDGPGLDRYAGQVTEARRQLSMLGTDADPCPKEGS